MAVERSTRIITSGEHTRPSVWFVFILLTCNGVSPIGSVTGQYPSSIQRDDRVFDCSGT